MSKCIKCKNEEDCPVMGMCVSCIEGMIENIQCDNVEKEGRIKDLEAELEKHQWVSVEERLPDPHKDWEIELFDVDGLCRDIASTQYINDKPVYLDGSRDEIDMDTLKSIYTHWKPIILPESEQSNE